MGIINFETPEGIAWTLCLVAAAIIVAPRLAELVRLPGLIGLILAGFVIGPHGLDLAESEQLDAIGEIGLLFLMFLAGLELDLNLFAEYRRAAVSFGLLTFTLPFTIAGIAAAALGYDTAAAILIGSIWASHTLVAYPALRKLDVVDNPAVATAVGATVITDTIALVVLAVVVGTETGEESGATLVLQIVAGLGLLTAVCFLALPWVTRILFEGIGQERELRFVWLLAAMTGAAALADSVGIEGIVGAFFAGIALNRLVPNRGALMDRTQFVAGAIFIPAFLISVGDLIEPSVIANWETIRLAAVFLAAVVIGKYSAAWLAGRAFHFSAAEVGAMFSLSVAQAAATLAATIVGYEAGILDKEFLNAAVVVVSLSLFIASVTVARFGPRLPATSAEGEAPGANVIVPIVSLETTRSLIGVAARIALSDGGVVRPVHVVHEGTTAAERKKIAATIDEAARAEGVDCEPIVRVDSSIEAGVRSAVRQYEATMVLMEAYHTPAMRTILLGESSGGLATNLPVPVLVVSLESRDIERVVVALDEQDLSPERRQNVRVTIEMAQRLAGGRALLILSPKGDQPEDEAMPKGGAREASPGGRAAWASANAREGDFILLPGRTGEATLGAEARSILDAVPVALGVVSPAAGTSTDDYAPGQVVVGRSG
jgi:Kef-type K+ transport system membrane component KefB